MSPLLLFLFACGPVERDPARHPAARQCRDTYDEYLNVDTTDPEVRRTLHLRYYFPGCKEGCDKGKDFWSCGATAHVYGTGKGLGYEGAIDLEQAQAYAKKACELHGSEDCTRERLYRCQADPAACQATCDGGDGPTCVALADPIDDIGLDAFDGARAGELHGKACAAGVDDSCAKERQVVCASDPLACQAKCDASLAPWCWQLSWDLERGIGKMPKNPAKAAEFARRACELDAAVDPGCEKVLLDAQLAP